ncbi:MAG: hypothetical protein QOG01_3278 [Pseudonocardiales bacterium]|nr:hypothetical protein [Pseudonocardiales bacterium]
MWIGGLAAGFFGLLGAVARYGCGVNDNGLACRGSGSTLGVLIVVAVVSVVTVVTVLSHERPPRRVLVVGGAGLIALLGCFLAARGLLDTV